ncbi:hypothetical protein C0R09_15000 [Brevibacillus laterosporus]|uniref:hypothetical protein n=1 Tax=Brevibacillus laterosporus TaxID=1465 RepID=UPI000C786478|nr:hypothetical protein [Brevibacillus laterosporus]AUM65719.1 hypothetical protein C0R09_15000 [Brevibacillus laterosporus]
MYRFASNPNQLNIDGIYKTNGGTTLKFNTYIHTNVLPHQYRVNGSVWFRHQDPNKEEPIIYITGEWLQAGPLLAYLRRGIWYFRGSHVNPGAEADFYFDEHEKKVKVEVRLFRHPQGEKQYTWRATKIR